MCSPSPPPPPDYTGAAQAQGQANIDAAVAQGHINNPNVVGPYGTQTVTWNGNDPTLTQTLSPAEQQLLNQQEANRGSLGDLASTGIHNAQGIISSPLDLHGAPPPGTAYRPGALPGVLDVNSIAGMPSIYHAGALPPMPASSQAIRDQVINAMMGRSNIDIGKQQDQAQSDLVARGIAPGTKAYEDQMDMIQREKVDALQQAQIAGGDAANQAYQQDLATRQEAQGEGLANSSQTYGQQMGVIGQQLGEQAQRFGQQGQVAQLGQSQQGQTFSQDTALRQQAISELLAQREIPLNEITALMSGSQVSNPFSTPGYAQNGQVAPAPIFGATQAQGAYNTDVYNSQAASSNSFMNGLFGLGAAAMMGPAGAMIPRPSDRRLKSNVVRVGTHPLGIGIYDYDIGGRRERGVMADEVLGVKPEAVVTMDNGYLGVDYGRL